MLTPAHVLCSKADVRTYYLRGPGTARSHLAPTTGSANTVEQFSLSPVLYSRHTRATLSMVHLFEG